MSLLVATLGHTTWPIELIKDPKFAAQVRDEKVDVILNAHSLFLIRKEMSEAPRLGSFNLHPVPPTVRCTARRGWHGEEWRRRDACSDEWILVRQVFREGIRVPTREALKAGDRLADA